MGWDFGRVLVCLVFDVGLVGWCGVVGCVPGFVAFRWFVGVFRWRHLLNSAFTLCSPGVLPNHSLAAVQHDSSILYSRSHIDFVGLDFWRVLICLVFDVGLVDWCGVVGGVPGFLVFRWFVGVFRWRDGLEICMRAVVS